MRRKRGVHLGKVDALVARIEEHDTRSVELPVRTEDLDRDPACADHLGCRARGVLLHPLMFVHREEVGAGRLAHHFSERRINEHQR